MYIDKLKYEHLYIMIEEKKKVNAFQNALGPNYKSEFQLITEQYSSTLGLAYLKFNPVFQYYPWCFSKLDFGNIFTRKRFLSILTDFSRRHELAF